MAKDAETELNETPRALTTEILSDLDEAQRSAVCSEAAHGLVIAPPGSGKTRVLAARFAMLVQKGVRPEALLAVTFTNRSAAEMKERIASMTGLAAGALDVTTFHGFSLRLLKKTRPPFLLYGRPDTIRLLKDLGVKNPAKAARMVSALKNNVTGIEGEYAEVLTEYSTALKREGALDLDDLVTEAVLDLEAGAATRCAKSHIMVDEYQDINASQARLVRLVAGSSGSVLAIGDPDQAIYSFRGASLKSFLEFSREYPGAEAVNLTRNYRCSKSIAEASARLVSHNSARLGAEPVAVTAGGTVRHVECADEKAEAGFIIKEIEKKMGGLTSLTVSDAGLGFSDFAVLVRTNRQADLLAEAFERSTLPYYRAAEQSEGCGEFIAHLKRASARPGVTLEEFLKEEASAAGATAEVVNTLITAAKDLMERPAGEALDGFIEEALLMEPEDYLGIKAEKVSILTLHMAKGLEFKCVFIAGFEDGLIPYTGWAQTDMEEERRLLYVGMTRAKDSLYLVRARSRNLRGSSLETAPSRFLSEIPAGLVTTESVEKKKTKRRPVQNGLFD